MKSEKAKPSRRTLLAGALASGMASPCSSSVHPGQAPPPQSTISPADIEAFERTSGRSFLPNERQQMVRGVSRRQSGARAVRKAAVSETTAPAVHFSPSTSGLRPATQNAVLRLPSQHVTRPTSERELAELSALEIGALIRQRDLSSTEITKLYLERLRQYGPRLNCVVNLTEELALKQAAVADRELASGKVRGPLHGVPYGLKDLFATKRIPTTFGVKVFEKQIFDYDATVVQRLAAAGCVLVAKLSMGELAMGDVWFGGTTRCPWNPARGSSGSSAGSCAATAAGLVGFAIGTETLGSIVSPCVRNGTTGLRPTFGRVSRHGAMALSWTMDKVGPITRSVSDTAAILKVISGPDGKDTDCSPLPFGWNSRSGMKGLRVGIDESSFAGGQASEAARKAHAEVKEVLTRLGVKLKPITLPPMNEALRALPGLFIDVEGACSFEAMLESGSLRELVQQGDNSWPNAFRSATTVSGADYLKGMRLRAELQLKMNEALKEVDAYVAVPNAGSTIFLTNLCGQPTVVTRCGITGDTPLSIEFVGNLYREDACLSLAYAFEQQVKLNRAWPDPASLPITPPPLGGRATA